MPRFLGNHTLPSAAKRLASLVRGVGLVQTCSTILSVVDDKYLRTFDRRYRVKTSDFILLSDTKFDPARLRDATQYGPVNGWAFRKLLKHLGLPRRWHFADLGCGLGRACVLAAEYGFEKVTGVELAPEFCAIARENIANCRPLAGKTASVEILQLDALDFCDQTDADIFFMFRPFSGEFLQRILQKLVQRARQKPVTIIYSERLLLSGSYATLIAGNPACRKTGEAAFFGQAFYIYQCGP